MLGKKIYYVLLIVFVSSCSKDEMFLEVQEKVNQNTIKNEIGLSITQNDIDIIYPEVSQEALTSSIYHFPAKVHMESNGQEYIIHNPSARLVGNTFEHVAPIQMKKIGDRWVLDKIYKDIKIGNSRNVDIINNNTYLVSDAAELPGGIGVDGQDYLVTMNGGELSWRKINQDKRWSHDISGGDLNGDGLMDVVSASPLSIYIQNSDKIGFTKKNDLYKWEQRISAFAVEVVDVFGDSIPEIITGGYYGSGNPLERNNLAIYSFNKQTKQFEIVFDNKNPNIFFNADEDLGATSIEVYDFNKDGKKDIAIARESHFNSKPMRTIEVWENKSSEDKCDFGKLDKIVYTQNQLDFTEFICKDVNNDGNIDIILNGNGRGSLLRLENNSKFRLNHLIHLNDGKGKFTPFSGRDLNVDGDPDYLYPIIRNNKLSFFGTKTKENISGGIRVTYWDVNTNL